MSAKIFRFLQKRIWVLLPLLVGIVLGLPLTRGLTYSLRGNVGIGGLSVAQKGVLAFAPESNGDLAAKILAAQLPLLTVGDDYEIHLPVGVKADDRFIMPIQTTLPWGAVGFIDNGCTGVLIDSQHVLAAAHCFTFDWATPPSPFAQGDWQPGLVYFPNYHPDRTNPPRVNIDRVVVGTRVETGGEFLASDWGIGHLATPVTAFPSLDIQPILSANYPYTVMYAGYARDPKHFPTAPYPQPAPGGYCPYFGNNCWWTPALVDPNCLALSDTNNNIFLSAASCPIIGGNSGSPVIWDAGTSGSPAYRITGVVHGPGWAPGAARFLSAPRFAGGVALATYNDGSDRTQVFATDTDSSRVVSRYRQGTSVADSFTTYAGIGQGTVPSPGRMAAFKLTNNKPQVVVIGGDGELYTSFVDSSNQWSTWTTLDRPNNVTGFLDVDAAYDANGTNQLYVIGDDNRPYTRRRLSTDPYAGWGSWEALDPSGSVNFHRISAIRRAGGTQQVFLVSTTGAAYTMEQLTPSPSSSWSAIVPFNGTGTPPALRDLDATWTESERVQIIAVDVNGGMWNRTMVSTSPSAGWNDWLAISIPLYAPQAAAPPAVDDIVTLTASVWQEEPGVSIVPVVLATDSQGNIYYSTHGDDVGWEPWRSFYH